MLTKLITKSYDSRRAIARCGQIPNIIGIVFLCYHKLVRDTKVIIKKIIEKFNNFTFILHSLYICGHICANTFVLHSHICFELA